MNAAWVLLISLLLLVLKGFFVAAEFALVAAKRHRLEQAAATGGRAARAALAGSRELSMMLAGAQLGITVCILGLGALAKPEVADLLGPVLDAVGLPHDAAYVVAFNLAVAVVGFLHVVIGDGAQVLGHQPPGGLRIAVGTAVSSLRPHRPAGPVALNGLAKACLRLVKVPRRTNWPRRTPAGVAAPAGLLPRPWHPGRRRAPTAHRPCCRSSRPPWPRS